MNYISKLYLRVSESVITIQSVYLVIFTGMLAVTLFVISAVTTNHNIETWGSFMAGFALAIFLICLPALINYFKKKKSGDV